MRLIDADALLKDINDYPYGYRGMIKDTIARQPTVDAVEVIRCKDCKWRGEPGCAVYIVDESDRPKDDDFCSWGERKEDETEPGIYKTDMEEQL